MLRYFIFIEYGLLPDLRVGVLISASQIESILRPLFKNFWNTCGFGNVRNK